jgi:hypothetical protein
MQVSCLHVNAFRVISTVSCVLFHVALQGSTEPPKCCKSGVVWAWAICKRITGVSGTLRGLVFPPLISFIRHGSSYKKPDYEEKCYYSIRSLIRLRGGPDYQGITDHRRETPWYNNTQIITQY